MYDICLVVIALWDWTLDGLEFLLVYVVLVYKFIGSNYFISVIVVSTIAYTGIMLTSFSEDILIKK